MILTNEYLDKHLENTPLVRLDNVGTNNFIKMSFRCKKYGHTVIQTISQIFRGHHNCKECKRIKLIEELDSFLLTKNIQRGSEYVSMRDKMNFICLVPNCGKVWSTVPPEIQKGHGCPRCRGNEKLTNEMVDKKLLGTSIERIDDYIDNKTKIRFKCLTHNHIWKTTTNHILSAKQGCKYCAIRKREKKCLLLIEKYCKYDTLEPHKLLKFNNRNYLPDFYLLKDNQTTIIEYNGKQHYEPVNWNGAMKKEEMQQDFINQQKRDEEMRQYCSQNNITLLEIPYWWKEVEIIEALKNLQK